MLFGFLMFSVWSVSGIAATCEPWIARVVSLQGAVEVKRSEQIVWSRVKLNDEFCANDHIRVGIYSRAGLLLSNDTLLRLDQGTTLVLPPLAEEDSAWLELLQGAVHFISNIPYQLKVKTPFVNAAIEGTEFAVRVSQANTRVWVLEGKVLVENQLGNISLGPGEAAVAEADKAPVPYLKIKPRDAVQWALYYPPIIDYSSGATSDPSRQRALSLYRSGQIHAAIEALNSVADEARDSGYFAQRAAILLSVGQVQDARRDIEKASALSPGSGVPSALQSIIALTQSDKEKAMSLAQDAVKLEPESPIPMVALSYAQQAAFDIEGARESIKKALQLSPDDPLAWARLSELELSTGELGDALAAAKEAESLDPELSRTQMVLGFAQLSQIDIDEARQSFSKAIELDPSAPLPRLGMGLAKIRQGDIEEGTKDIEIAAVLDPENSLIRSYLGKAYYEEKRGAVASREFARAKQLDPKDPTPWFYDAIYKQTVNRPVEALHDMQKAIELNDNRAVYRSSLLLDDDLAARSASLGRIYSDLGFEQRALLEGWKSANSEPSNFSAHRLLADSYAALPRREIARSSELLQSQLWQPLNINAIQPELAETNLAVLNGSGPSDLSFNELNPLFTSNSGAFQANGIIGSNHTLGDNLILSGIYDWFSFSIGQFHYQTEGFNENDDINHDIYNIFLQASVTPDFSVQAEYRRRDSSAGSVAQGIIEPFDRIRTRTFQNVARIGARYQITPKNSLIASVIYQNSDYPTEFEATLDADTVFSGETKILTSGFQGEIQHQFNGQWLNSVVGLGYIDLYSDVESSVELAIDSTVIFSVDDTIDDDPKFFNAYIYPTFDFIPNTLITLGGSFDSFHGETIERETFNPKLGVIVNPFESTTVRAAYLHGLKRPYPQDQTIEPTHVAGFNQFYDDFDADKFSLYGVGLDQRLGNDLLAGVELSWRHVTSFLDDPDGGSDVDHDEAFRRAYIYWTPIDMLAISAEYKYEDFDRNKGGGPDDPDRLRTHLVPLKIKLFHPNGLFASFGATYVHQKTEFELTEMPSMRNTEKFWVADLAIGFRLPKRYGIVSFEIRNLFDRDFVYQSFFNRVLDPRLKAPPFQPKRSFLGRLNLWFH